MFDFIRFVIRNPSYVTKHWRSLYATRKQMRLFREKPENQECKYCGRSIKLEVHHLEPVSVAPKKAGEQSNLMMLCRKYDCHKVIGHGGDFKHRYVENAPELCAKMVCPLSLYQI